MTKEPPKKVIDEATGKEVEIVETHASAAMSSVNHLRGELPPGAGKILEAAMAQAAEKAATEGITDPATVKELMLKAREDAKAALRTKMENLRSQIAAAERDKAKKARGK